MARNRIALSVTAEDKAELERLVRSGKTEQRIAFRSRIILRAALGMTTDQIAKELDTSRPTVIDWRKRYRVEGLAGLYNDRRRGRSFAPLPKDKEEALVTKTLQEKPVAATHGSCRTMAEAAGVSKNSVARIWYDDPRL